MSAISETYNCDCYEYMRTLPDKYFDLCIADPPYGIAELVGCGRETARRICHGKDYPDYQRQSRRKKKRIELNETLGKFKPEQIIDYLRHLGYKGELTLTTTQTIKL